jgi:hypothetical protein
LDESFFGELFILSVCFGPPQAMKIAFADSSFYVALLISRDANHAKSEAAARSWTGDVTTE